MSAPEKEIKTKLVVPENVLKKKVGNGGFDEAVLQKAQNSLDKNTVDFRPIATELLDILNNEIQKIKSESIAVETGINLILFPMMQLKAQGGLFHYPTITNMTFVIVDFIEDVKALDKDIIDILDGYMKSARAVLLMQVKDPNHKIVKDLIAELESACKRYKKAKAGII